LLSLTGRTKDPLKVRAGTIGARTRWGPQPRSVRLDELTTDQRRLVLALIAAAKETAPANDQPGAVTTEGHGNDRPVE
jgi:hypothetical protein